MTTRIEHYHDPHAPRANSIVPAVTAVVTNDKGEILLQKRVDNGLWALPGGVLEIGESAPQAAVREVKEETGIDIELTGIVGVFSDPHHVIEYSDGEVRQQFSLCFKGRAIGGTLALSRESHEVRFVRVTDIDRLDIHDTQRLRIHQFLRSPDVPFLG